MNLIDITIKNIKKNIFDYKTYFLSTCFAVTIFYIFSAIFYNPDFSDYHLGVTKIGIVFKISAATVFLFSSVFVFYSNSLFIKAKKREIAIYTVLGMRKINIGMMMFYETFIVGLCSIISGILIGIICSRFFSSILIKLMLGGAPGNNIEFHITLKSVIITFLIFIALFLVNSINSFRIIYKYKLIDLLHAEKKAEKAPRFSKVSCIVSVLLIAASYCIFLSFNGDQGGMVLIKPAFAACILMAVGTYLLFHNLVIWIVYKFKSNSNLYFKPDNLISTSQLGYYIKANSNILCLVSLISAFTVTIMSASISLYAALGDSMAIYSPFSYLCENIDSTVKSNVLQTINDDKNIKLTAETEYDVLTTKGSLDGYRVDTNSAYGKLKTDIGEEFRIDILKFSDYKNIVNNTHAIESDGNKGAIFIDELPQDKCLFLDGNYSHDYSENSSGKNIKVTTDNGIKELNILSVSLYKYMGAEHARTTIVVNDDYYNEYFNLKDESEINHYFGFNFDKPLDSEEVVNNLNTIVSEQDRMKSYIENHMIIFGMYGAYIFIGIFLGVLFLISSGGIVFYKQLMESRDEIKTYDIVKKIGMSAKDIISSVKKQVGFVFFIPLIVAVSHISVMLITYKNMMYTITTDSPVLVYAVGVAGVYALIYGVYYLISVKGYMNTINRSKV
ncbi:MAG: ABC transporter permease [Clostridiaceae bacterium]|nr:ABC transporter permease [Clostridiaceae bacterium]